MNDRARFDVESAFSSLHELQEGRRFEADLRVARREFKALWDLVQHTPTRTDAIEDALRLLKAAAETLMECAPRPRAPDGFHFGHAPPSSPAPTVYAIRLFESVCTALAAYNRRARPIDQPDDSPLFTALATSTNSFLRSLYPDLDYRRIGRDAEIYAWLVGEGFVDGQIGLDSAQLDELYMRNKTAILDTLHGWVKERHLTLEAPDRRRREFQAHYRLLHVDVLHRHPSQL